MSVTVSSRACGRRWWTALAALLAAVVVAAPARGDTLVAGGLTALPAPSAFGPDRVVNGDFESPAIVEPLWPGRRGRTIAGWRLSPSFSLDPAVARSGRVSLRLDGAPSVEPAPLATQTVLLTRGVYRISGWIRGDRLGANRAGAGVRLTLAYGAAQRRSTALARGTFDWRYVEARDIVVPADSTVVLRLESSGAPAGRAWFDDVRIDKHVPRLLDVFLLYPNFRGMLFDDQSPVLRFDVSLETAVRVGDYRRFDVVAGLTDEADGTLVASSRQAAAAHLVAALDGTAMRPERAYLATVSLVSRIDNVVEYAYPASRVSKVAASTRDAMNVAVDDANRVLVHGVPRFVMGVYDSGMGFGATDAFWERLLWAPDGERRLAGLPINFYLNYWYGEADAAPMKTLMSSLQERGVMYLQTANCFERHAAREIPFRADRSDAYVADVGAHPGSAGYYTIDECDASMVPGAFAQYQRLKALDPDAITFAALMGNPPSIHLWRDAADVVSADPYPMFGPEPAGGYRHLLVAEWTRQAREAVKSARPVMTVLQFFRFTAAGRWPTRQEMRNHAYMAIVEGARGLWWWSLGENGLASVCRTWCAERVAHMNDLRAVMSEIAGLERALLADDAPAALAANSQAAVRTLVKGVDGRRYLFAYNAGAARTRATFTWSSAPGAVQVVGEARTVRVVGAGFTDDFGPYEAHAYVLQTVAPPG